MFAKRRLSEQGFTIIETLIVIAIAGLIMLIVFLAIPALQRSSRNNQRKQDTQAVLEAISRYQLNNSGNFLDCSDASCRGSGNLLGNSQLTYYSDTSATHITVRSLQPGEVAPTPSDKETIYIFNHQKCNTNGNGAVAQGGYSDIVALYALETSNSIAWRCQQF